MRTRRFLPLVCCLIAAAQDPSGFRVLARVPEAGHARIQPLHEGRPVWGRTIIVPLGTGGRPVLPHPTSVEVAQGPRMDATTAITRALEDLALPFQAVCLAPPAAEEVVFPAEGTGGVVHVPGPVPGTFRMDVRFSVLETPPAEAFVPAWVVRTRHWDPLEGLIARDTVVEARTGRILRKDPGLRYLGHQVPGRGLHAGNVTLEAVRLADGRSALQDTTRPSAAHPLQPRLAPAGQPPANLVFTRWQEGDTTRLLPYVAEGGFGDGAVFDYLGPVTAERLTGINGQTAAVDVAWGLQLTWDLLKQGLGRHGADGQGGALAAAVHAQLRAFAPYPNAYWDPAERTLNFGDGGSGTLPFTSLDVVAHEIGHALMSGSADLVYSGESGGLDEATSDMLAMAALCYAAGGGAGPTFTVPVGFPWTLGNRLFPSGSALRSLKRPSRHGNFDGWFEGIDLFGVYQAGGPASRFFYYLSAGFDGADAETTSPFLPQGITGIGIQKALRVWVRALEAHVEDKRTGYSGMRAATEAAARALFGTDSTELAAVQDAWAAVNVGAPHGQATAQVLRLDPGPWPGGLGAGVHTSSSRDVYVPLSGVAPLPRAVLEGFPADTLVDWNSSFAVVDKQARTIRPSLWNLVGWNTSFEATIPGTPHRAMAMLNPVVLDLDGDGETDASDAAVLAIYSLSGVLPSELYDPATMRTFFPPDPAIYRWNRAFGVLMGAK